MADKTHAKQTRRNIASPTATPSISACMIVKDEEHFLPQCLNSIKDIVDEIIVVDTGSTDRTVRIAKQYTDKVYVHPWQNSFSKARNQALAYAAGDWILQIDADEELVREDMSLLKKAVKDDALDAVMIQIVSILRNGKSHAIHSVERLFRNTEAIYYRGRIHESLVGIEKARVYPIRLTHHGYDLNRTESTKKFERTVSLLQMDLQENPEDAKTVHYLGCSYLTEGLYQDALDMSLEAIHLAAGNNDRNLFFLWSHYNAAISYYRLKNLDEAEKICRSALDRFPKHIDSHYVLSLVLFDQKRWPQLIAHGNEYLRLVGRLHKDPQQFGNLVTCSVSEEWNIQVLIGIACFETEKCQASRTALERAVACAPEAFIALRAAGIYFYNKKNRDKALEYLTRARSENSNDPTVNDLIAQINTPAEDKAQEPTISCCMIVKNEEAFLKQCLDSVKAYVDEIIIVDTGSTDKSVEIARQYTDKVYFHAWEDSFSKARNQALSYATGDWILQIDGDEELVAGSGPKLRQAVREAGPADAFHVNIISTFSNGMKEARHNFERLFRNNGMIHYAGIVHNRVEGAAMVKASRIEMMHYGYDVDEKKASEKFLRTKALLIRQIAEEPDNPMPHHYLGTSYLARNMLESATDELVRAIDLAEAAKDKNPLYLWSHHNAALAFFNRGHLDQADLYSLRAIEKCPQHLDSFYMLAVVAAEKEKWQEVLSYGKRYLELLDFFDGNPERAGLMVNSTMREGYRIHLLIGHALHALKENDRMADHYQKAYELSDPKWRAWWLAGCFHLDRSRDLERARSCFDIALKNAPEAMDIWYMQARLNRECRRFTDEKECLQKLRELGNPEAAILKRLAALEIEFGDEGLAIEIMENIIRTDPADVEAICSLGDLHAHRRQMDQALACYSRALEIDSRHIAPRIGLGKISLQMNQLEEARSFFEGTMNPTTPSVGILLYLGEIDLRQNRIVDFVDRCDRIMEQLGLDRNITIQDMRDVVGILLDIGFSVKDQPGSASQVRKLLGLLPSEVRHFLDTRFSQALATQAPEKTAFMREGLQAVVNA